MSTTIDYGIDLGTTNSCVARWENGAVKVFQNNDQMNVTPSAVHILKTGRVIVGRRGYAALLTDPDNVAIEFKRWMGQKDRRRFPAAQRELSAEELSAEVLKSLKEDVRRQTGDEVTNAVITVPAAFGALQCEATARAAELAGLGGAVLLQEPIAAAIGYGASPRSANQRWLVFDLGGGTLDVAVVSTRDGRLNVLEHKGNNLLGGKDIDRLIVDNVLLPALESTYDLSASGPSSARSALLPRLRVKAEEAKIDLSTAAEVVISLFDLGEDDSGGPIDIEVPLTRVQLARLMGPLLEQCCALASQALGGARLSGRELDRVLLVGGPTQSPLLREALKERLGAPVDFSVDPMTVVGRGAAIYASAIERPVKPVSPTARGCVRLKLAYEPVSQDPQCAVAGRVEGASGEIEIKIEAEGGLWTSGWVKPRNGMFELVVSLKEGDVTTFWVYARDGQGRLIETDKPEFRIRHGLVPTAPPLPHSLSVEVLKASGTPALDLVFPKGTPLPAEKTVKYRATHSLAPDKAGSDLAIKLWEGEFLDDPEANEWVGNVVLSHTGVRRTVPEGAEIEVTIQVSASRLVTVDAFVPHLNQNFSDKLYVPQREEQDFSTLSQTVGPDLQEYRRRLNSLGEKLAEDNSQSTRTELEDLRRDLDELDVRASATNEAAQPDPDDSRRVVEEAKTIRGRLGRLERRSVGRSAPTDIAKFADLVESVGEVVNQFGTALEKQQMAMLRRELERAASRGDDKVIQRVCTEMDGLRWRVLFKHDWFWREIFDSLCQPGTPFVDATEARRIIGTGQVAITNGDGEGLRAAVRSLWNLQPKENVEATRERAVRAGLRKF
jgi:molecular chaperone DnaK